MKWEPLELPEQDKAFIEARDQSIKDILCTFGVAPALLGVHKPHTQEEYENALARVLMEIILDQDIEE